MINITRILSVIMTIAVLISPRASIHPAADPAVAPGGSVPAMLRVLRKTGIEFSEETGQYIEQSMDDMIPMMMDLGMDASQYISYPFILSILGTGKYDASAHSFALLTDSVYAFDAECYDITEAYGDFLLAIARISNGDIKIDGYHSDVDDATFESGTGVQEVFFNLNGKPYTFSAQFEYDWLDCAIIDYVNVILEEQGIASRLWCMFDGEQGFVVLCNTAEWAQTFTRRTNYPLALTASEAMKVFSRRW